MPTASRLLRLVSQLSRARVAVAGDIVADEFIYGQIERVSREAPVLILGYDTTVLVPGGAGNAASNVAALTGRASLVGLVGRDEAGRSLSRVLGRSVDVSRLERVAGYATPVKTRILAGGVHSAKQQVVRIDRAPGRVSPAMARRVERALVALLPSIDVLIISDYGSQLITPELWARVVATAGRRRRPRVLVDSRYALDRFRAIDACTPNESEVEALLGVRINDDRRVLEDAGRTLLDRAGAAAVLITRGSRGMALFERRQPTVHIPIVGSDQVTDVTGAGDTVIATFAATLAAGASYLEAAHVANYAGGLVVMKRGTATVSAAELADAIRTTPADRRRGAPRSHGTRR
jgi:rfaE bifunctional protein kinase chain/domain